MSSERHYIQQDVAEFQGHLDRPEPILSDVAHIRPVLSNRDLEIRVQERSEQLLLLNRKLEQEIESRKVLEETLRDSQLRLRNLSGYLQHIREEERKSIAREIHDEFGQLLAAIQMGVSLLAGEYADHRNLVVRIKDMEILIVDAIKTVQRISSELRPVMLDHLGLGEAMEWQAQEFQRRSGIVCNIDVLLLDSHVDSEVAIVLFRIFQECLTNVQRHSLATKVQAKLVERGESYLLTILDNGKGISKEDIASPLSIGLIGMRERACYLGGRVKIYGSPLKGTALLIRVPVKPKETWHVLGQEHNYR